MLQKALHYAVFPTQPFNPLTRLRLVFKAKPQWGAAAVRRLWPGRGGGLQRFSPTGEGRRRQSAPEWENGEMGMVLCSWESIALLGEMGFWSGSVATGVSVGQQSGVPLGEGARPAGLQRAACLLGRSTGGAGSSSSSLLFG